MVRPFGRRSPASGQHVSASGVRTESPSRRRRLVHRSAHQRVAEPEPARHLGAANKIEAQQLINRFQRHHLRDRRGGRGEVGLEWVAGDCRTLQHEAGTVGQQPRLLRQCHRHRGGHLDVGHHRFATCPPTVPTRPARASC